MELDKTVLVAHFYSGHKILDVHIKKWPFRGISALEKEFKLSHLADALQLCVSNIHKVVNVVDRIQGFSSVSGLKINLNKSVLFLLKESNLTEVNHKHIKNKVTYLGVIFEKEDKILFDFIWKHKSHCLKKISYVMPKNMVDWKC